MYVAGNTLFTRPCVCVSAKRFSKIVAKMCRFVSTEDLTKYRRLNLVQQKRMRITISYATMPRIVVVIVVCVAQCYGK